MAAPEIDILGPMWLILTAVAQAFWNLPLLLKMFLIIGILLRIAIPSTWGSRGH